MSDHYCCKACGLRYDECSCGDTPSQRKRTGAQLLAAKAAKAPAKPAKPAKAAAKGPAPAKVRSLDEARSNKKFDELTQHVADSLRAYFGEILPAVQFSRAEHDLILRMATHNMAMLKARIDAGNKGSKNNLMDTVEFTMAQTDLALIGSLVNKMMKGEK